MLLIATALFSASPALAAGSVPPYPGTPYITVTKVTVMEIYPPKLSISGTVNSSCYTVRAGQPQVVSSITGISRIAVPLSAVQGVTSTQLCSQTPRAFTVSVVVDRAKLKLAPGRYPVWINPGNSAAIFKTSITLR